MAYALGHNIHDASSVYSTAYRLASQGLINRPLKLQVTPGVIPCSQAYMCLLS